MPACSPADLVGGLAETVTRGGVRLYESTPVTSISAGRARTQAGDVRAPYIVRCTEGFTADMPGQHRTLLPMNSSMIITGPLGDEAWRSIGWDRFETLGDEAHAYIYAQRTADGRIALGGRGVPYRFGSGIDHDGAIAPSTIAQLGRILRRMFPAAAGAGLEHAWCGVLGVPRDWCATVTLDPQTGLGWAGGYSGHGVAAVQPGRPDARRPRARRPQPAHHPALGRPPLAAVGTGAGPLDRGTRPVRPVPDGGPAGDGPPVAAHLGAGPRGRPDLRDTALATELATGEARLRLSAAAGPDHRVQKTFLVCCQARSNRSRFMTLSHAATKSPTNFSFASSLA